MAPLNSNMTSDSKPEVAIWSKLRMRCEKTAHAQWKIVKLNERQRQTANIHVI